MTIKNHHIAKEFLAIWGKPASLALYVNELRRDEVAIGMAGAWVILKVGKHDRAMSIDDFSTRIVEPAVALMRRLAKQGAPIAGPVGWVCECVESFRLEQRRESMNDDKEYPEWLKAALERIKANAPREEVISTPERAAELRERIGTTVRHFQPYKFVPDPQASLDDMRAMELIRAGLVEMPLPEKASNG